MRSLLAMIVAFHSAVFVINTVALVVAPATLWRQYGVWSVFIAVPLLTMLINASWGRKCPLTAAENYCRRKTGMPEIPGFVEFYVWGRK